MPDRPFLGLCARENDLSAPKASNFPALDVGCWLLDVPSCPISFPLQKSPWFRPGTALPVPRQMAVESKPLLHSEVLRQQVRSFNLPDQTAAWQPKLQHWADLIRPGSADGFPGQSRTRGRRNHQRPGSLQSPVLWSRGLVVSWSGGRPHDVPLPFGVLPPRLKTTAI